VKTILYYAAGYIARSLLKRENCADCQSLICDSKSKPETVFEEEENRSEETLK